VGESAVVFRAAETKVQHNGYCLSEIITQIFPYKVFQISIIITSNEIIVKFHYL